MFSRLLVFKFLHCVIVLLLFVNNSYGGVGAHGSALQAADACFRIMRTAGKYTPRIQCLGRFKYVLGAYRDTQVACLAPLTIDYHASHILIPL